jgi:hypothetical protein
MTTLARGAQIALAFSTLTLSHTVVAQSATEVLRRPVGAPQRVMPNSAVAEVRTYALARVGDRALACFVRAGMARNRGALECAMLRREADGALARAEADRMIAPQASAVAVAWDASGGLIVWVVPKPHRNESERVRAARHRDGVRSMQDSLSNPLGTPGLTAGDVMAQRLDANGAPVGRPTLVFAENARAYRVAVARDEQGWLLAWTGARTREGEVRGTIRAARLDGNGALVGRAIETDFSGQTGDALRWIPREGALPPRLAWSGEHCRERPEQPRHAQPAQDPSAAIETRPRFVIRQGPLHEHEGPNITCDSLSLYTTTLRADGSLAPLRAGPLLARDALALADGRLVYATRDAVDTATLATSAIDAQGQLVSQRVLVPRGPTVPREAGISAAAGGDDSAPSPSRVGPLPIPDRTQALRAPIALDAAHGRATQRALVALSPTHNRVVLARFEGGSTSVATSAVPIVSAQPVERAHEVSLLSGGSDAPWLFVRVGSAAGGPLVYAVIEGQGALVDAPAEQSWTGDERLRTHLLRARAARAAVTDFDHTFGPVSARSDAASNPAMPGLVGSMRRLRARWSDACDSLQARARFLVRRGVDRDLETLARQQCELPPEPAMPGGAGAAPSAQGAQ